MIRVRVCFLVICASSNVANMKFPTRFFQQWLFCRFGLLITMTVFLSSSFYSLADVLSDIDEEIMSFTETHPENANNISGGELSSLGYNGSWDQFCNPAEIEKDFHGRWGHELRTLRCILCAVRSNNDRKDLFTSTLAVYKYCQMVRPQIDKFLSQLLDKLSQDDKTMRRRILSKTTPVDNSSTCYHETTSEFDKLCIGQKNIYFSMFARILARTCSLRWLSTEDILSYIRKVCASGKWITGDIDWAPVVSSLNFTNKGPRPNEP